MANEQSNQTAGARRALTGRVSAISGEKTIKVVVDNLVRHRIYGKYIRRRSKLTVHDPQNGAELGDVVEIVPCRRMSKSKSWRLARIVRRSDAPYAGPIPAPLAEPEPAAGLTADGVEGDSPEAAPQPAAEAPPTETPSNEAPAAAEAAPPAGGDDEQKD